MDILPSGSGYKREIVSGFLFKNTRPGQFLNSSAVILFREAKAGLIRR